MAELRISSNFSLPVDAVTRSFGMLGMRGSGKSNAAVVLAEEMFRAGLQWVVIDPAAAWWGIRSSADGGKNGGLPVVIFGGEHADIPLEPTAAAGVLVADTILNEHISAVLDLSQMTKGQKIAFLVGPGNVPEGFAQRLFRKKRQDGEPMHLFLEEAHDYVPKLARNEVGKLVEAVSNFQTIGRGRGFGCTVLSQRSARIHNDVLSQIDTLFAFRTVGPHDRKAIALWVKEHDVDDELVKSLPDLKDGESWLFSPEWLGKLERLAWRRRSTYDSGATPKVGQGKRKPATLADIDIPAVNAAMAETIERNKADDPKELRRQIRVLEAALSDSQKQTVTTSVDNRRVDELERDLRLLNEALPALRDDLERSERRRAVMVEQSQGIYDRLQTLFEDLWRVISMGGRDAAELPTADDVKGILARSGQHNKPSTTVVPTRGQHGRNVRSATSTETEVRALPPAPITDPNLGRVPERPRGVPTSSAGGDSQSVAATSPVAAARPAQPSEPTELSRLILRALLDAPEGRSTAQVALMTGYSISGGFFRRQLAGLRQAGLIEGASPIVPTQAGLMEVANEDPIEMGRPLLEQWLQNPRLGTAPLAFVRALADARRPMTTEELGQATGYAPSGGYFRRGVKKARDMGVVLAVGRELVIAEELR